MNDVLRERLSGLKLTCHILSEKAHAQEEVADTYIVLNNVMGGHSSHTELVDLDIDLLSDAAQTGALGEGCVELALRRVLVNNAAARENSGEGGLRKHRPQVAGQGSC